MLELRARWLAFYAEKVEPVYKEIVSHIEKMIIGTLIVSAGAHVSSNEPAIQLFGYLRHSLIGRGVMLVGFIVLLLNFIDGLYKLSEAELACCMADPDVGVLHRDVGPPDPAHPRVSRRMTGDRRSEPSAP